MLGSRVQAQLSRKGVKDGDWYLKRFENFGTLAPYCSALTTGSPKREDICRKAGKPDDDPLLNAATKDWGKPHDNGRFEWHMLDFEKGDRWEQGGWGSGSISKYKRAAHREEHIEWRGQDHEEGIEVPR